MWGNLLSALPSGCIMRIMGMFWQCIAILNKLRLAGWGLKSLMRRVNQYVAGARSVKAKEGNDASKKLSGIGES